MERDPRRTARIEALPAQRRADGGLDLVSIFEKLIENLLVTALVPENVKVPLDADVTADKVTELVPENVSVPELAEVTAPSVTALVPVNGAAFSCNL